jgi:hypothetical protein
MNFMSKVNLEMCIKYNNILKYKKLEENIDFSYILIKVDPISFIFDLSTIVPAGILYTKGCNSNNKLGFETIIGFTAFGLISILKNKKNKLVIQSQNV